MYSLMIVDDEPLMLKYLSTNINKLAPDWTVASTASDGLQAVKLLQRQSFDLVLTDIRMPEMDGLELAKFINEIYPKTKVIIISGYDDFDYARRAIRCGVSDYLLKPLNDKNISEVLQKTADTIYKEKSKYFFENILNKADKFSDSKLRSIFLSYSIKDDNSNIKSLYPIMTFRNINLIENHYFCIMILGVDCAVLLKNENSYQKLNSCKIRLNQECVKLYQNSCNKAVCYCECDNTAVLFCGENKDEIIKSIDCSYSKIQSTMEDTYHIKITGSCGYMSEDILCLQKSYYSAVKSYLITFINNNTPIYPTSLISYEKVIESIYNLSSSIYSDYISNNKTKLLTDLTNLFKIIPNKENYVTCFRFFYCLICYISHKSKIKEQLLEKAVLKLRKLFNCSANEEDAIKTIFTSILLLSESDYIENENTNNQLVDKAKEYINLHYNEPISLTLVAEKLGVSASYLSDLFHKEVGEPYSKFITRVRMEQALTILKVNPNKKIYNLASQVGYVNAKHFNSVFKKYFKMTPTEYLQKN